MTRENLKSKAVNVGKTFAAAALAIVLAQGAMIATSSVAKATVPVGDGTCFTSKNICGLNGHNYSDHTFQGG